MKELLGEIKTLQNFGHTAFEIAEMLGVSLELVNSGLYYYPNTEEP
jgi:hypothetical protein